MPRSGWSLECSAHPESKCHVQLSSGGISQPVYKLSPWRDLTPGLPLRAASPPLPDALSSWGGEGGVAISLHPHIGLHSSLPHALLGFRLFSWPGKGQKWPEILSTQLRTCWWLFVSCLPPSPKNKPHGNTPHTKYKRQMALCREIVAICITGERLTYKELFEMEKKMGKNLPENRLMT